MSTDSTLDEQRRALWDAAREAWPDLDATYSPADLKSIQLAWKLMTDPPEGIQFTWVRDVGGCWTTAFAAGRAKTPSVYHADLAICVITAALAAAGKEVSGE